MSARSKQLFILIGNDATGKTTVQRNLIRLLNGAVYRRVPSNQAHDITNPYITRKIRKVFVAGRSYQELKDKPDQYTTVEDYFCQRLDTASIDVDLAFMASHLDSQDIRQMIRQAHRRFWNVCAVFFTNSISMNPALNADISTDLPWDERWYAENTRSDDGDVQERQLGEVADAIVQMLIERTRGW